MTREPDLRRRAERSDSLANRRRILEAALKVFAERGLEAEIREIAERAGVGVGTVYRHFGSREGLVAALIERAKEDVRKKFEKTVLTQRPDEAIRAMVHIVAEACDQFGALIEDIITGELQKPEGAEEDFKRVERHLLQCGIDEGIFDPNLDVPVALAVLKGLFTSGALADLGRQRSMHQAADSIADFILEAIKPRNRGPK